MSVLHLRNNDKVVRRVQVLPREPAYLSVQLLGDEQAIYTEIGSSKVACGMEVAYTVTFHPESDGDYALALVVITDREKFLIPVRCKGLKAVLDLPDEISFPPTPAKCCYKKNVMIHNVGNKRALFMLESRGAFHVNSSDFEVEPGSFVQCCVHFLPSKACNYEGELEICFKDDDKHLFSRLLGTGSELDVGLSAGVASALPTYIRKSSQITLQIFNRSAVVAYFIWTKFATRREMEEYKEQIGGAEFSFELEQEFNTGFDNDPNTPSLEREKNLLCDMDKAFTITPAKGEVWPGTLVEIAINFCPQKALRYVCTTFCTISGKSNPLPLQVQGLGIGPHIQFVPCELDLGEISLYSRYVYDVTLENVSELEAHFRLLNSIKFISPLSFSFQPELTVLEPKETQRIEIEVSGNVMGKFDETYIWEVADSIENLSLRLKGNVVQPSFDVDTKNLDFGFVSYGLRCTKEIRLRNNSPVPLTFVFSFTDVESTFNVIPSRFELQSQHVQVVVVEMTPLELTRHAAILSIDIENVVKNVVSIPIQAECLSPEVTISANVFDFGTCYIRYPYTSNLNLINNSKVPAKYEVSWDTNLATIRVNSEEGIIPALSQLPIEITISTQCLGEISMEVLIVVSGKEPSQFTVRVCAVSSGPLLKLDKSEDQKRQHGSDEQVEEWKPGLDFGKVQVLQNHCLSLLVRNLCCIPAQLALSTSKKNSVFRLPYDEASLAPYGFLELKVVANLDDASKFRDTIGIVYEGGQLIFPVSAHGVGSTLSCAEMDAGRFYLGNQFTMRAYTYNFTVRNLGRKQQSLTWDNVTMRKAKSKKNVPKEDSDPKKHDKSRKQATDTDPEPVAIFSITPDKAIVQPFSSISFTVSSYATKPGSSSEEFSCKVTCGQNMYYKRLLIDAEIAALTLVFSKNVLKFVQNNGYGGIREELSQHVACQNVSKLPLSFSLFVKPPFQVNKVDWTLGPSQSADIVVTVRRQEIAAKTIFTVLGKLDIVYTGTLEKDHIELVAEVNYPNLCFDFETLDFGFVVENTYKRLHLTMKNISMLEVIYHWSFVDNRDQGISVCPSVLQKCGGRIIPVNRIFDILPVRGHLHPGEQETVEISYYAHCGYQCNIVALCEVEGGPQYTIALKAGSGHISYDINTKSIDFCDILFSKVHAKDFCLSNMGKVPFGFVIDLSSIQNKTAVQVIPTEGYLNAHGKQKILVNVRPGYPERLLHQFKIQVAFFVPICMTVEGNGSYSCVSLDIPRIRSCNFLSNVEAAFSNIFTTCTRGRSINEKLGGENVGDNAGEKMLPQEDEGSRAVEGDGSTEQHTIEEIDTEIDRLLFKEFLLQKNQGNAISARDIQSFIISTYVCDLEFVVLGETKTKSINIRNMGTLPVTLRAHASELKCTGFVIDPLYDITISAVQKPATINISLKTDAKTQLGRKEHILPLFIKEAPQVMLLLKAEVTIPTAELSNDHLDFGHVQIGHCKVLYVRLCNTGKIPCVWSIKRLDSADSSDSLSFSCFPEFGTVMPEMYFDIQVRFIPAHKKKAYHFHFAISIMHNPAIILSVSCKGWSYMPAITIDPAIIDFGSILPNAPEAIQAKYTIRNDSDEPVEIYSLDFDEQYLKEEEVLRGAHGYDEHNILLLELRNAGKPFWDNIVSENVEAGGSDLDNTNVQKVETVSDLAVSPTIPSSSRPMIIIYGPPLVGKSTQAKLLGKSLKCLILDLEEFICSCIYNQKLNLTIDMKNESTIDYSMPTMLSDVEKELIALLKTRLQDPDCSLGVIFDGLNSSYLASASLLRCVLYSLGLEPFSPSWPEDIKPDNKKKTKGDANKNKPKNGDAKREGNNLTATGVDPNNVKIFWRGLERVYVIAMKANKDELLEFHNSLPEIYHCKKKATYGDPLKANNEFPCPPEDGTLACTEPRHLSMESSWGILLKNDPSSYPYVSVFPSSELLDSYFAAEENIYGFLGKSLNEEEVEAMGHKIKIIAVNALQDSKSVFEEASKTLPLIIHTVDDVPAPVVLQAVKKPIVKRANLTETSGLKFNFFTIKPHESEEDSNMQKQKKGKGHSKALEKQLDKTGPIKAKGQKSNVLTTPFEVPDGCVKETRWIIPPKASVEHAVLFWSADIGEFEQKFLFEGLGNHCHAKLICKGISAYPEVTVSYKHVYLQNKKLSLAAKAQKKLFISNGILDFGPLPVGRSLEGFPELPDSEHCKRVEVCNNGRFDLHIDFEICEDFENKPTVKKDKGQDKKASKQSLFLISPGSMDLKVHETKDLSIYSYPNKGQLGENRAKLIFKVKDNPTPIIFPLICFGDTPRIGVDCMSISFDRLLIGRETVKDLTIKNLSMLLVHWKITGLENGPQELSVGEVSGDLAASASTIVAITFRSLKESVFNQKLKLQVVESKDSSSVSQEIPLSILAEAYKIEVLVKLPNSPEEMPPNGGIDYGIVKVANDSAKPLFLENKGKYPVAFKFSFSKNSLQDIFSVVPPEGTLDPKKQQKVDMFFNKEKTLQKEIELNKNNDVCLNIIEKLTGIIEQTIPIAISIQAMHSRFILAPEHGVHFGPQICGMSPVPRILKVINEGKFDFTYKLLIDGAENAGSPNVSAGDAMKKNAVTKVDKDQKKGKKTDKKEKAAASETLELRSFTVSPALGTVLSGSQQDIAVKFKTDIPCSVLETFRMMISDMDPILYNTGILYELSGESCIPTVNIDTESIFRNIKLLERLDLSSIPESNAYYKKDNIFSFGAVIIEFDAAGRSEHSVSKDIVHIPKIGQKFSSEARFRFENPSKVPCSLQFSISRYETEVIPTDRTNKGKAGSKELSEDSLCMEVHPTALEVPPLESRYVTCLFRPLAIQTYNALFEVALKDGNGVRTSQFRCELRGEGTLPRLYIESPTCSSPSGLPWLKFPRLLLGKSLTLPFVLVNDSTVPAVARIQVPSENSAWIGLSQSCGELPVPLNFGGKIYMPAKNKTTIFVTFIPLAGQQYEEILQISVDYNPFDIVKLLVSGEGYGDEVVCIGLPRDMDDTIWFEDTAIGAKSSVSFTLKNTAADRHWRFMWADTPCLSFSPSIGHLHQGTSKDIFVSFSSPIPVEYIEKEVKLQLWNIIYPDGNDLVDWDDRISGLSTQLGNASQMPENDLKNESKTKNKPVKKKSKAGSIAESKQSEQFMELQLQPKQGEPVFEAVKGSAKCAVYKVHAVADNIRYTCSIQTIHFKPTMMFQTRTFSFKIENISRANMQFSWRVCMLDFTLDRNDLYMITPEAGILLPGKVMEISIRFCPTEVQDCTRILSCEIPNLDASLAPLQIPVKGQVTRPWCHFELPKSDYALIRDPNLPGPNGSVGPLDLSVNIIEFESVGANIRNVKYFTALNPTNVSYRFVWEPEKKQSLVWTEFEIDGVRSFDPFKCITKTGEIPRGERYEMGFEYIPDKLELKESFWIFRIPERNIEVRFLLVGKVKKPGVALDLSFVEMGEVLVGHTVTHTVQLNNPEAVPFAFAFDKLSFLPSQPEEIPQLRFNPETAIVAPESSMPVEVSFSPLTEGRYTFDAVCDVKKAAPLKLTVKGEGYRFHEKVYLEGGDSGFPLELSCKVATDIVFGEVLVNSKTFKKLLLTNQGRHPFQFMWKCQNPSLVHVEPSVGIVSTDEQVACDLVFSPTVPGAIKGTPVICHILHGNNYTLLLSGNCFRATAKFSFLDHDFGPHFIHHQSKVPPSIKLFITNTGALNITCELLYQSTSFLEVEHTSATLGPSEILGVPITFKPDNVAVFRERVEFRINGLDIVAVNIKGEGVPVILELMDSRQQFLSFGAVKLGQSSKELVQLINKSKIPMDVSFEPSKDVLEEYSILLSPACYLPLQPKQVGILEMEYKPKSRMPSFSQGLVVEVAGCKSRLLTMSGSCLAIEVKLSSNMVSFDTVALGSHMTKRIQLENHGDFGVSFKWDVFRCAPEFSIFPKDGFLPPGQVSKLDVVFCPTSKNHDIRVDRVCCQISGEKYLYLTLTGGCHDEGSPEEVIRFKVPVRSSEVRSVQIKNNSAVDWLLHPKIINEFWCGPPSVTALAGQTVSYDITYRPLIMSMIEPHKGSLLFPLPNGSMLSYQLFGEAGPPLPDGELKLFLKARSTIPVMLPVQNWLKSTQRFHLLIELNRDETGGKLIGQNYIDIAALSKENCILHFYAQKRGITEATITFKVEESGEYCFFVLGFEAGKADVVEQLSFNCLARQYAVQNVHLKNTLDSEARFVTRCQDPMVIVPHFIDVQPKTTASVQIMYKPIIEGTSTCILVFENSILGEYEYELRLKAAEAAPERLLSFSVSLGNQQSHTFYFKHSLPIKTAYSCAVSQEGLQAGFTVEPASIAANPAGPDGLEMQAKVLFEPSSIGENVRGLLTVKSAECGEYKCQLLGICSPPSPQGPILIKGSGQITFKNVFDTAMQFTYETDNPAFTVSKGEKLPPKKQVKLVVTYKGIAGAPTTGKLMVKCIEVSYVWMFYLQAV